MEDTASHETVYKLAHRADKANPWSDNDSAFGRIVIQLFIGMFKATLVFECIESMGKQAIYHTA